MPSVSPGRGARLVADTENLSGVEPSSSIELIIVDFPVPEGADTTMILPDIGVGEFGSWEDGELGRWGVIRGR